jgi:hypothetical protein
LARRTEALRIGAFMAVDPSGVDFALPSDPFDEVLTERRLTE